MREIKFRAWARRGEWEEDGEHQKFIMLGADVLAFEEFAPISELLGDVDDDFYLMQYTGLKDKNGKEIYEGDIVASKGTMLSGRNWEETKEVRFNPDFGYGLYDSHIFSEVIGNIYENPELIKEA